MSWLQLCLTVGRAEVDALQDALLESGALSVTLQDSGDDPVLEPGVGETPLWNEVQVTGLFTADTDTDKVLAQLASCYGGVLPVHQWQPLAEQVWERAWMADYVPIQCGPRLWICPSWCAPPDPAAANLILDPGLAFGSGTHPTTFLCLQWLESQALAGKIVIDYGCGSGILGIAALLLGAERVIAVDNDPQALLATRDNADRNHIAAGRIRCCMPNQIPNVTADLVLANILAAPLVELALPLTHLTKPAGSLCLSGIFATQCVDVQAAYCDNFDFDTPAFDQQWARLTAVKKHATH